MCVCVYKYVSSSPRLMLGIDHPWFILLHYWLRPCLSQTWIPCPALLQSWDPEHEQWGKEERTDIQTWVCESWDQRGIHLDGSHLPPLATQIFHMLIRYRTGEVSVGEHQLGKALPFPWGWGIGGLDLAMPLSKMQIHSGIPLLPRLRAHLYS